MTLLVPQVGQPTVTNNRRGIPEYWLNKRIIVHKRSHKVIINLALSSPKETVGHISEAGVPARRRREETPGGHKLQ